MRTNNRELLIEKYIPPTEIDDDGDECWYDEFGELHSVNDQPSIIEFYEKSRKIYSKTWHKNGRLHRAKNRAAYITYRKNGITDYRAWYENGRYKGFKFN